MIVMFPENRCQPQEKYLNNPIKLDRVLAVFDLEATGLNRRTDRIVELSLIKIHPDETRESYLFQINPGIPIPAEVTAIHGITDEDIKDAPTFKELAPVLADLFEGCDLAGYNLLHFDIPMLQEEFQRVGQAFDTTNRRVIDAQRIFHVKEPRTLSAALQFYCNEDHTGAHSAQDDVEATIKVLFGQVKRYPELPRDSEGLDTFCNPRNPEWVDRMGRLKWLDGKVVINFGKKQDARLGDLARTERGFLQWIIKNDFPQDTRDVCQHFVNGGNESDLGLSPPPSA